MKRMLVFDEAPTVPSGLVDVRVLKAGVFKAPLIFVSAELDLAWL